MNSSLKNTYEFLDKKRVLITGGAGFIGSALIRRLLDKTNSKIFNLDKLSYSSSLISIEKKLRKLGSENSHRYKTLKVDLANQKKTQIANNNLVDIGGMQEDANLEMVSKNIQNTVWTAAVIIGVVIAIKLSR